MMRLMQRVVELLEDRRSEERHPVLCEAELRLEGRAIAGILLNLSQSGAQMAATSRPVPGDHGKLVFDDYSMPVRVIWVEGYRFGLLFDHAQSEELIHDLVVRVGSTSRARD